jgi:hypothetical protein
MGAVASTVGNTVGQFIPWPCNACGKIHMISQFGGNIVDRNARCPTTGRLIVQLFL